MKSRWQRSLEKDKEEGGTLCLNFNSLQCGAAIRSRRDYSIQNSVELAELLLPLFRIRNFCCDNADWFYRSQRDSSFYATLSAGTYSRGIKAPTICRTIVLYSILLRVSRVKSDRFKLELKLFHCN